MKFLAIGTALLVTVLAGCSAGSSGEARPSTSAVPSATTTTASAPASAGPPQAQEYGTVVALKDAAVAAGYVCPTWNQNNAVTSAAESGNCSDADVFMTFLGQDARDQVASFLETTGSVALVGPNWIINSADAPDFQLKVGGTVVRPAS